MIFIFYTRLGKVAVLAKVHKPTKRVKKNKKQTKTQGTIFQVKQDKSSKINEMKITDLPQSIQISIIKMITEVRRTTHKQRI